LKVIDVCCVITKLNVTSVLTGRQEFDEQEENLADGKRL